MKKSLVLIADDDDAIRTVVEKKLQRSGFDTRSTNNGKELYHWIEKGDGDLIITDVVMPEANGLELLPLIKDKRPRLPVIVISGQNTVLTAIKANDLGAYEYLPKPFDLEHLLSIVLKALDSVSSKKNRSNNIRDKENENLPIIGRSPPMQEVYRVLAKVVSTDLTVMIRGESGTGKELVAKALHDFSKRKNKSFIAVNMAAIPRELIESELFGHEKGSFTGADQRGIGYFEQANGGTLFLDEIGDMPLEAQTRLLRVLQDGSLTPVGGRKVINTDIRIVTATHRDLTDMIEEGLFREDLFYRLNVIPIILPPLRERVEDISLLVDHFLNINEKKGLDKKIITQEAIEKLMNYKWPGNVRELENVIRRLVTLNPEETINGNSVDEHLSSTVITPNSNVVGSLSASVEKNLSNYFDLHKNSLPPAGLYNRVIHEIERPLILKTLALTNGNQIKAAELLGINRNTLRKKISYLDIQYKRSKKTIYS